MITGASSGGRRRGLPLAVLVLPAAILVCITMMAPMVVLFRYSLNRFSATELMISAVTWANYLAVVTDPYYRVVLGNTLVVAGVSTLLTLLLGFPAAYALARMQAPWKSWMTLLTLFPLLVGNVVRSAGWMVVLGTNGMVNAALQGAGLTSGPVPLMYTTGTVIVGIVTVVLPYMILTLASVIEGIPGNLEEAATNLGAPPSRVFLRVVLPLALPGVAAGCALVFILCMNAYTTPVLLGGAQFKMMAPAVYDQFVGATNWPFGAALAFVLLVVTLGLTLLGSALLQRRARVA